VTDPRTGLPSSSKFLPNVAEVRAACVTEAERLRLRSGPKIVFRREEPPAKPPGDLFIAFDRPRYSEMNDLLAKQPDAGRRDRCGIWIPYQWYDRRGVGPDEEARLAASRKHFERECRDEGIDPARGVSPSLLKTLEKSNEV